MDLSTASQGYLPTSTYVTGWMVAQGWPPSSLPTSVKWVHYTNDLMPTCKDRSLSRDALQTSLGCVVNLWQTQDPGTAVQVEPLMKGGHIPVRTSLPGQGVG